MADFNGFSMARRGYDCTEVDEYIACASQGEKELRESYALLQEKYDKLFEENGKLLKEKDRVTADCTTLALALKQLRENPEAGYREKYEAALAELESMKSIVIDDGYKTKYEETSAELERLKSEARPEPQEQSDVAVECGEAASQMVAEVAEVVQKLEKDARRKAEAITLSAKLEQAQAQLIKSRVAHEVKSLIEMLECYLDGNTKKAE